MKKLLALLMSLSLVVFTGCSGDKTKTADGKTKTTDGGKTKTTDDGKTKTTDGNGEKETTVEGNVTKSKGGKVTVNDKDYDISDAAITGDREKASDIAEGDAVTITLKGGKITKVVTKKKTAPPPETKELKDADGTVTDVTDKTVTVKVKGEEYKWDAADKDAASKYKKGDKVKISADKDGKVTALKKEEK